MWAYDQLNPTQLGLLKQRILVLDGDVDQAMGRYVNEALLRLQADGSPPITVKITSGGGDVMVGLDIYDFLTHYPGEVTGVVLGFASSMAAVILQACKERRCARHARILIHHVSRTNVSLDTLRSKKRTTETREDLERSQARIYEILRERSGQSLPAIRRQCALDVQMPAKEAKAFGLIDKII